MFKIENFLSIILTALVAVLIFVIPLLKQQEKKSSASYQTTDRPTAEQDAEVYTYKWDVAYVDSIYNLMDKKLDRPTYFYQEFPLLFLLSGKILEDSVTHALVVQESFNSSMIIELWQLEPDSIWNKKSDLFLSELPSVEFDPYLADYNFDGIKDIYIPLETVMQDRYPLQKGLLCTIDSAYTLRSHPEVKTWSNFELGADSTQVLYSESYQVYDNGAKLVCRLKHQWIDKTLVTAGLDCP